MSKPMHSDHEMMALIRNTLQERDPMRQCVVLGSAAVVAHFYEADVPSPVGCEDVDALCSPAFFAAELTDIQRRNGISKVQVRWPKGRLAIRGAKNLSLDIFPEAGEALLPFTVATDMSDNWIAETYDSARQMAVTRAGIICKPIADILLQIARIGRDKDIENVRAIEPIALQAGLISEVQASHVSYEIGRTLLEREKHPERYYPRVPI